MVGAAWWGGYRHLWAGGKGRMSLSPPVPIVANRTRRYAVAHVNDGSSDAATIARRFRLQLHRAVESFTGLLLARRWRTDRPNAVRV
jgi:hypothetical protein